MKGKDDKEKIKQPVENAETPEYMQYMPQFAMMPGMYQYMPEYMGQCAPQLCQQTPACYTQPQYGYQASQYSQQQTPQYASQWGEETGACQGEWGGMGAGMWPGSTMCPGMGPGAGYGMGPGAGYGMGPGAGYGMGPGAGYGMGPGMGLMYPMMNPYNYVMRVRPVVDYGINEAKKTSMKHAMTEVALITYLMGMGYDYSTAHRLVESWEIDKKLLKE